MYARDVALPPRAILSESQLATLAEHGEERSAQPGERLYDVGDREYPFIAIREGEVAIVDAAGAEIVRHGASGFLGEINLLSGQTVFVTALVTQPTRYVAVERGVLRSLLFEDGSLADVLLSAFMARREALETLEGVGLEIAGPRSSEATRRIVEWVRRNRLPHDWRDTEDDPASDVTALKPEELPLVRIPGGPELRAPTSGDLSRTLGIGLELSRREEVDLAVIGGGPAGLGAAVYGASEGLETLVLEGTALGGQAGTSRRIENYLGFPAGISGSDLTSRAVTQARKFGARTATPYRALALEPATGRHVVRLEGGGEVARARGRDRHRRRLPPVARRRPRGLRGRERLLRRRAARGAALRRDARRRRRRRQFGGPGRGLARARRCAGDAAAPPRRPARDDVRLPDRRARPLRRRGARPQRDHRAARRRRRARGGHAA